MMYMDLVSYLPDDILVKVDRASMASSLETRVPLLDHRLVEFSLSLPVSLLRRNGQSKWPLRQILYRHIPPALVERPKMGFGVPLDRWLRGPLRAWAEDLLHPSKLKKEGYFHTPLVTEAWRHHQSGKQDLSFPLWNLLMFQAWLQHHSKPSPKAFT
jgi:asparagine synthase (glutamine-hydrolysing)